MESVLQYVRVCVCVCLGVGACCDCDGPYSTERIFVFVAVTLGARS